MIVTVVPTGPDIGAKDVMIGAAYHVKPARVEFPPVLVTVTSPVAPVPTSAFILFAELIVKFRAATPPMVTLVTPVNDVPLMFRIVPYVPCVGVKRVIFGSAI